MSRGPYPELLVSRRDRPGSRAWEVQEGPLRRGEAWSDLLGCVLRVPFGGGEHGRIVRAHELMHARISPCVAGAFTSGPASGRALECAEEFRVNEVLRRLGFDLTDLRDGSERLSGRRLVETGDVEELVLFAAAVAGTGAFGELLRGVRARDRDLAARCRALERELRRAARDVRTASLAATTTDASGVPSGFAVHTRRFAEVIERAVRSPRVATSRRRGRPSPTGAFAPLILDRAVILDRAIPGVVGARRVPAPLGRRVVRPARLVTDPGRRCFEGRARRSGGIVVVDQSGSMALGVADLEELISAAPGALVLGYSHEPGSVGVPNAWVLADRGRAARTVRGGNVGNGVDGPALRFALQRRRPGERVIWVCDGQVTDSADHADAALAAECAELVLRHGISMVPDLRSATGSLAGRAEGLARPRLLGRVGAAVTAAP